MGRWVGGCNATRPCRRAVRIAFPKRQGLTRAAMTRRHCWGGPLKACLTVEAFLVRMLARAPEPWHGMLTQPSPPSAPFL